ncbi:CEP19-like protein-domain-containing protein [Globomyces pollinis-pini]|nr:CEP19-like protein-domain-containing protein [Globomyces pollinis-pini]
MATLTEIGVRFNPPYLVAYYDCKLGSRRRKIPVRAIKDELETIMKKKLDSTKLADEIISKHKTYLGGSSRLQIVRLLEKILDHHHLDFVPSNQQKSQPSKLPEQSKPNVTEKNDTLKKSSDPVMSDIGHISTNSTLKQDLKDINYVTEKANSSKGIDPKNKVDAIVQIDTNKNLNKLTDEELANVKSLMQKDFEKNQIAKGSSNFTYDLKVNCWRFIYDSAILALRLKETIGTQMKKLPLFKPNLK